MQETADDLFAVIKSGAVKVAINQRVPLKDAAKAQEALAAQEDDRRDGSNSLICAMQDTAPDVTTLLASSKHRGHCHRQALEVRSPPALTGDRAANPIAGGSDEFSKCGCQSNA